ncbi:MAG: HAMP domain-containing sensor histidine kinase [Dehalococcoidales bacterium]|jgi:signal transduction histidine kinase
MWLKKISLSFKLTGFYIISVLIVVTGIITYTEYNNYQRELGDAMQRAEVGPGFINGAAPDNNLFLEVFNNSTYAFKSSDIDNQLKRFTPFVDKSAEGGLMWGYSIDGPITIEHQDYYNVTYKITRMQSGEQFEFGPVTLPESFFPTTIAAFSNYSHDRTNDLYYLPVSGHPDVLYVVSLDRYTFPNGKWQEHVISDLISGSPLIIISAVVFGLLISWVTTKPLKRITRATELLSHSDLNQRVGISSGDEIGRLAQSFNTMADRLEESFNAQKRFVSDAAHELRTPLASMKTSVTKALGSEKRNDDYQKLLSFLSGRIDHMEILVNDLLFLSRVDEGRFKHDETRLHISALLNEAEEAFRYLLEEKGIGFSVEIDHELYVKGDRKLMLQVISNLLDNAAKNTPAGGTVSLRAIHKNKEVIITISDTGIGIPPEHLPHLFERFYKALDLSGDGYGLGLAIVKSIVTSTGGNISVQSESGKGSIFTIKLPRYDLN